LHFIHTADWQIGRVYGQFDDEDAVPLAQARIDTVAAIARQAQASGVDAVLVAGDVFDTQGVNERSIRRLFAALQAYEGPWMMIPGNHDAALTDSVWTRAQALGCIAPNVHVMLTPGVYPIPGVAAHVLAAPLTQRHTYDDVSAFFDDAATPAGVCRIGLAHGSVTGLLPDTIDSANPISPRRAATARLDYLALGDWHGTMEVDAHTWYSGTPEPDRFRNNESGRVLHVRIDAPGARPQVQALEIGRFRWPQWERHLDLASDVQALAHELQGLEGQDVLRLTLSGRISLADHDRLTHALAQAHAHAHTVQVQADALVLAPDQDDFSAMGADGYVATVVTQLQAMQEQSADADVAREALRLLVQYQRETADPA